MKTKKIILTVLLMIGSTSIFAQLNPIRNLFIGQTDNYEVSYDCLGLNCFALFWDKPISSSDTLIGYNVYRHDILYIFTTDTIIECTGNSPCYYPNFISYWPFWITVKAVYNKDSLKSIANDSVCVCDIAIGIEELNEQLFFSISPNPTSEKITINISQKATITISNLQGQLIKTLTTSSAKTNIDISALAPGMYFIKVITEKGIAVRKFIKE